MILDDTNAEMKWLGELCVLIGPIAVELLRGCTILAVVKHPHVIKFLLIAGANGVDLLACSGKSRCRAVGARAGRVAWAALCETTSGEDNGGKVHKLHIELYSRCN